MDTKSKLNPSVLLCLASGIRASGIQEWTTDGGLRIAIPFKAAKKQKRIRSPSRPMGRQRWKRTSCRPLLHFEVKYNDVTCSITNEDKAL